MIAELKNDRKLRLSLERIVHDFVGNIHILKASDKSIDSLYNKARTLNADIKAYIKEKFLCFISGDTLCIYSIEPVDFAVETNTFNRNPNFKLVLDNFDFENHISVIPSFHIKYLIRKNILISEDTLINNLALVIRLKIVMDKLDKDAREEVIESKAALINKVYNENVDHRHLRTKLYDLDVEHYANTDNAVENIVVDKNKYIRISDTESSSKTYNINLTSIKRGSPVRVEVLASDISGRTINIDINSDFLLNHTRNMYSKFICRLQAENVNINIHNLNDNDLSKLIWVFMSSVVNSRRTSEVKCNNLKFINVNTRKIILNLNCDSQFKISNYPDSDDSDVD